MVCFGYQASKRDSSRNYADSADNYGVSLIKFTCLSVFRVVRVRIGDGLINRLIGQSDIVERCFRLGLKIGGTVALAHKGASAIRL